MYTQAELDEYMAEIREHVCSRCIEKPPGAPPCAPQGKRCGIELHLSEVVEVSHAARQYNGTLYRTVSRGRLLALCESNHSAVPLPA